jgi:hypothetical protein
VAPDPQQEDARCWVLLEGKAEALTRRAVERALAGDPTSMRLCLECILPGSGWCSYSEIY